jgi:uroporphyrinogen decarboxylase
MTSAERIDAAIELKSHAPVAVAPLIIGYAARCAGFSQAEIYSNEQIWRAALRTTFEKIGMPDAVFPMWPRDAVRSQMLKVQLPGRELDKEDQVQFIEEEIMNREDYDQLVRGGYQNWFMSYWTRIRKDLPKGPIGKARTIFGFMRQGLRIRKNVKYWERNGVAPMFYAACYPPFDLFSLLRSLPAFCYDLADCPEKILQASEAAIPVIIKMASIPLRLTQGKRICIYPMRSSSTFISQKMFLDFSLPYLKRIVETFARQGIVSVLHCDGNWDPMLPYFREFPQASCIVELDGDSDIFRAKEILGDWLCLKGNVPASMLAFREPEEVYDYCRKLIAEVGRDGGFILSSGCEVPLNAKLENVKAVMSAAGKQSGKHVEI